MAAAAVSGPLGDRLDRRQKWLLMGTMLVTMFVTSLNQQIVATAAPRIVADLGGFKLLPWVFTIFMLSSTIVTPLTGKLSDTFGRRPFMIGGMVVFILASAACGLSVSMPMLIAARALQGIGAGMAIAILLIVFWDLFPPAEGSRLMPLFITVGSTAQLTGPTLGGFLTDHVGWRWNFFVGMPVAIVAIALMARFLPSQRRRGARPRVDTVGALLLAVTSGSALLALSWAQEQFGWGGTQTLGLFALAIAAGVVFALQERRHPEAILPLHLFRNRGFMLATAILACASAVTIGAATYLPTFLQTALGTTATTSGLVTTPQAVGSLSGSFLGGQLLARTGRYRWQVLGGIACMLVGVLLVRSLGVGDAAWRVSIYMAVIGIGGGICSTTMTVITLNSVAYRHNGVAIGTRQFLQQNGTVLAIALYGVILTTSYRSGFDAQLDPAVRARLPADVVSEFYDPTLALDARRFGVAQDAVRRLDGGESLLVSALGAQRNSVAHANQQIFLLAAIFVAGAAVAVLVMREVPLRRSFAEDAPSPAARRAAGTAGEGPAEATPATG